MTYPFPKRVPMAGYEYDGRVLRAKRGQMPAEVLLDRGFCAA